MSMNETTELIEQLTTALRRIPGRKILTLMTTEHPDPLMIEFDGGDVRDPRRYALFRTRLAVAFAHAGALIIRQMLPLRSQEALPDGRRGWVPRKNLYGVSIVQGTWMPLSQAEMRRAHGIDCRSGRAIGAERNVSFGHFPET